MTGSQLLVALDPNVCVAAGSNIGHRSSQALLNLITATDKNIAVAIDVPGHTVLSRYSELAGDADVDLQKWWAWLFDRSSRRVDTPSNTFWNAGELVALGCVTDLEPELLGMAAHDSGPKLLVTGREMDHHPKLVSRGVHNQSVVVALNSRCPRLQVFTSYDAEQFIRAWCKQEHKFPETEQELKGYLADFPIESDDIEYKYPFRDEADAGKGYSACIVEAVAEAICQLGNSYGGWVFLGVDESEVQQGIITGFEPVYFAKRRAEGQLQNADELQRQIIQLLNEALAPVPNPGYVRMWPIRLSTGRYVVVFKISKADMLIKVRGKPQYRIGPRKQYLRGGRSGKK